MKGRAKEERGRGEAVRKLIMCKESFHSRKLCFHCENFQENVVTLQQWSKKEAEIENTETQGSCMLMFVPNCNQSSGENEMKWVDDLCENI